MIVVTVGTMHRDFARLVRAVDRIAADTGERAIMQIGMGTTRPEHTESFDFRSREEMASLYREARVVVAHAGIGTVIEVLRAGAPLIVVPRLQAFGEHNNDHQCDLARAVERRGWGRAVDNTDDLPQALAQPPPVHANYRPARDPLIADIRATLRRLTPP